jgi:hypothetical protein
MISENIVLLFMEFMEMNLIWILRDAGYGEELKFHLKLRIMSVMNTISTLRLIILRRKIDSMLRISGAIKRKMKTRLMDKL